MNKQLSTNTLFIVISLLGVSSAITPASASLTSTITAVTKTEVPKTVQSVTTTTNTAEVGKGVKATVQETTNTTVGQLAGVATDSKTTAQVKDPSQVKLPSLDNLTQLVQTTGQAAVVIKADQQSTQADAKADLGVQIADLATVGICLDANATLGIANKGSSANCSKAVETPPVGVVTLAAAFQTLQSVTTITNTATAEVGKGIKATVQETTNTTLGQLAGVATDSKTTVQVKDPSQVKLPSLDNPTQLVQTTGQAAVGIKADQQSTQADAKADLGVQIADLATVGICLDANATLGIANKNSSANCSKAVETPPVGVVTLAAAFQTLQSVTTITNTATAEVGKGIKATVQETTNTTLGQLAGVATDSKTTVQVKDPSQVKLPSLDNPTQLVQTTGQAAVGIKADQQSTQADAKANLGVQIADLATVGICLDANATLGIANKNSSANCSKAVETPPVGVVTLPVAVKTPPIVVETPPVAVKTPPAAVEIPPVTVKIPPVAVEIPPVVVEKLYVPIQIPSVGVKPHPVPEPTTLGGLALLGVYLISRRRRVS